MLVPIAEAALAIECVRVELPAIQARLAAEIEARRVDVAELEAIARAHEQRAEALALELERAALILEPAPAWKHPALWAVAGLLAGAAGGLYVATTLAK